MARTGHDVEWMSANEGRDDVEPSSAGFAAAGRRFSGWGLFRNRKARAVLGGLTLLLAFVTLARVGARNELPAVPAKPPHWLVDRPLSAPLSPFMAAECWHRGCRAVPATGKDLRHIRAGLNSWFSVTGTRVLDKQANVRGAAIEVQDGQGDDLAIREVRVSAVPTHWDGQSAVHAFSDGFTTVTSRWVMHKQGELWLVESRVNPGVCDTDEFEYSILSNWALAPVPASQIPA